MLHVHFADKIHYKWSLPSYPSPCVFGIPNCIAPMSSEFQSKKAPLPQNSKMPPMHGIVWIFSGVTQLLNDSTFFRAKSKMLYRLYRKACEKQAKSQFTYVGEVAALGTISTLEFRFFTLWIQSLAMISKWPFNTQGSCPSSTVACHPQMISALSTF